MFMGPLEVSKPWSDSGVEGAKILSKKFMLKAELLILLSNKKQSQSDRNFALRLILYIPIKQKNM